MTTTVTVDAHLSDDKEVHVKTLDDGEEVAPVTILQDGESCEKYAYDGRQIIVEEVEKP